MGNLWNYFWNYLVELPLVLLNKFVGLEISDVLIAKIIVVAVYLFILYEIYARIQNYFHRKSWGKSIREHVAASQPKIQDNALADMLQGARDIKKTAQILKKQKQYDRLAEVYASLNRPKDAAKWFMKAKDRKRAAEQFACAGNILKAAKILMKEGEYGMAGHFFEGAGKFLLAADAYGKQGDMPSMAGAYGKAGKHAEAVKAFSDYFSQTGDPDDVQLKAADACYGMLQEAGGEAVSKEDRVALLPHVAERFEKAQRGEMAATLYHDAGQYVRAGDIFARLGRFQEAAACMRAAGKSDEAHLLLGRYNEAQKNWADAGAAYAAGKNFCRAGDCFAKANNAAKAAECYEKGGEYYGAGLAYSHLKKYDHAVRMLQHIKESDKNFDVSRALLGRCFYELHDYEHCAAALDNHLTGKRVESSNVDYWYMLALAYEQIGQLQKSRDLLYKIRTIDVSFKDVAERISSISSRISMGVEAMGMPTGRMNTGDMATQAMTAVESSLGGRYRLEKELGRGGMGAVYLAKDTQLDRNVALKFLGALMDNSEEFRQRFIREAKAAARVNHPNIVNIYEISANMGKAYIAMEFVNGTSLHGYLKEKGKLAPREAVNYMVQACSALDAIHKAGIVHRDIKPDNIMIAQGGLVKLMDFGLAKAEDARMTNAGVVMGTPAYMSPEQARGQDVDCVSDIYSLGLVLHEMLTGQTFFRTGDVMARQQTEMPPVPSTVAEGVPEKLDEIVMKCIAKDPKERFQSAEELANALREVSER